MSESFSIKQALESIHAGNEFIIVSDPSVLTPEETRELRVAFEGAYKATYGEETTIRIMKRNDETHGLLLTVLVKKDSSSSEESLDE